MIKLGRLALYFIFLFHSTLFAQDMMKNNAKEISKHYAAFPNLYHFDSVEKEKISDKISRQYVIGAQSMLVKWTLKKGAIIPLHFHPNEQITWITKGSVKVTSQNKVFNLKAGDVLIIPPNVPHEFLAEEETIDIDFFTPAREDWLNNTANYIQVESNKKR